MAEDNRSIPDSCNVCTTYVKGDVNKFCLEHNVIIKNPTRSCRDFTRKESTESEEPNEKSI